MSCQDGNHDNTPRGVRFAEGHDPFGHAGRGRRVGSRNRLCQQFLADAIEVWEQVGKTALFTMAVTDTSAYVKTMAQILPRHVELDKSENAIESMTIEELDAFIAEIREAKRLAAAAVLASHSGHDAGAGDASAGVSGRSRGTRRQFN